MRYRSLLVGLLDITAPGDGNVRASTTIKASSPTMQQAQMDPPTAPEPSDDRETITAWKFNYPSPATFVCHDGSIAYVRTPHSDGWYDKTIMGLYLTRGPDDSIVTKDISNQAYAGLIKGLEPVMPHITECTNYGNQLHIYFRERRLFGEANITGVHIMYGSNYNRTVPVPDNLFRRHETERRLELAIGHRRSSSLLTRLDDATLRMILVFAGLVGVL